jgi:L-amino acid N-acyltransferase YncA
MTPETTVRDARLDDAGAIARMYREGIEDRVATFETEPRSRKAGSAEIGVHRRHGRLDGEWRDCVVVEKLLGPALDVS